MWRPGGPASGGARTVDVAIDTAVIKRVDGHGLVTALRGTATPGAEIEVDGRTTTAGSDGRWAIRAAYDRRRSTIAVTATAAGYTDGSGQVAQPRRPKLSLASSTGRNTTTDATVLKGRVAVTTGSQRGVHIT